MEGLSVSTETLRGGVDKVERYDWRMLDAPGEFMWIDKNKIKIDNGPNGYQRDPDNAKSVAIAKDFCWAAFGVILVARTLEATYFCFDGGHRTDGAKRRSDVTYLPCMVFDIHSKEEQARMFLWANTRRRAMDAHTKHKAAVRGCDEVAIAINDLMRESGYRPSKTEGRNIVRCVAALRRCYETDSDALANVFPLVAEIANGEMIGDILLQGIFYLWRATDGAIGTANERRRIVKLGAQALVGRARSEASANFGKGGAKVWAEGMTKIINKGRPERNHLTLNVRTVKS